VLLVNLGEEPFRIGHGDRIAQLVIAPVIDVALELVDDTGSTTRGEGGFGSTGST
jgi:dUTP diphosphatase